MYKMKSSIAAKLMAVILVVLMLVSIVPVSGLAKNQATAVSSESLDNTDATPDEAQQEDGTTSEPEESTSSGSVTETIYDDDSFSISSSSKKAYKMAENKYAFAGLETITLKCNDEISNAKLYLDNFDAENGTEITKKDAEDADSIENYYVVEDTNGTNGTTFKVFFKGTLADGNHNLVLKSTDESDVESDLLSYEFVIDNTAPEIKIIYYSNATDDLDGDGKNESNQQWKKNSVYVKFEVIENGSGINSEKNINITGSNDSSDNKGTYTVSPVKGTNTYSFKVTKYQYYTITAKDNVGHESSPINTEPILVDNNGATSELSIEFSKTGTKANGVLNFLTFGLYANDTVTATVTVTNNENESPIEKIELYNKSNGVETQIDPNSNDLQFTESNNTYKSKFTLNPSDDLNSEKDKYDLGIKVTDEAGNDSDVIYLTDDKVTVHCDSNVLSGDNKGIFEVVVTNASPSVKKSDEEDGIGVAFDNGSNESYVTNSDGIQAYSGKGTFTATVTDTLSGLSDIKVYFDEESEFATLDANVQEVTDKCTISDKLNDENIPNKLISENITFNTEEIGSGKYRFEIVATNNSGNTTKEFVTVAVDNSAPKITDVTYVDGNDWTKDNRTVSFKVSDLPSNSPCGGINEENITVKGLTNNKDNYEVTQKNDNDSEYTFEADYYQKYEITVTDVFGLSKTVTTDDFIKVDKSSPNIGNFKYNNNNNEDWVNSDVTVTFTVDDIIDDGKLNQTLSDIATVDVKGPDPNKSYTANLESTDDENNKKVYTYSFIADTYGSYKVIAKDNVGNSTPESESENVIKTKDIKIDKTPPVIDSFKFESAQTSFDSVISFLTFGIYSNDDINVIVTASDDTPSSGIDIDKITLTSENGQDISPSEYDITGSTEEGYKVTKTFTLKNGGENPEESLYKLTAEVTDNVDLKDSKTVKDLGCYYDDNDKKVTVTNEDNFEVVSTNIKSKIESNTESSDNSVEQLIDGKKWYSKCFAFSADIKDEVSGIDSIKVLLNDIDITSYCDVSLVPQEPTSEKIKNATITLDTYEKQEHITLAEGENVIKTVVVNNSGNESIDEKFAYIDTTAPEVTEFSFTSGRIEGNKKPVVSNENYGYYFKDSTTVTVKANDDFNNINGSGVDYIHFQTIDINGKITDYSDVNVTNNEASFVVPANFKGQIYAYAVDKVTNKGNEVSPDDVIVENQTQHDASSSISFNKPSTSYKDVDGRDLYSSEYVPVTITVEDTYSGIAKIEYTVSAPQDQENNISETVEVGSNCKDDSSINGWKIESHDKNLATKMSKTINVKNNSNNISVVAKITDRAGHVTEKKLTPFSIDKTAPTVEVKFDNNDYKEFSGDKYFKANRTATITVTERNFDKNDFETIIKNTDGVIPALSSWSTSNNLSDPDKTTHTAQIVFSADGDYTLDVSFKDMAGNKANSVSQEKFTLDKTLPEISISFDNNSSSNNNYYKAQRVATITVKEHNFAADAEHLDIKVTAFGADNNTSVTAPGNSGWTNNGDVHTTTITFADDGRYSFTVDYTDLAYNKAEQEKVDIFYVDKTKPEIKFVDVANNTAYAKEIAPQVILSDNNYNGYTSFVLKRIDMESKSNDVDLSKNAVLNGSTGETITYDNFAESADNDGIYKLSVKLTDKAGNENSADITFSVNRFGSTFMSGSDSTTELIDSGYTNAENDIVIKEINVNKVSSQTISLALNNSNFVNLKVNEDFTVTNDGGSDSWHEYTYKINKSNFADEGFYTLTVTTTDQVNHIASNRKTAIPEKRNYPVSFTVDKTKPEIRISGIESNKPYEEASKEVKIVCEDTNIDPDKLVVKLNGETIKADDKGFEISTENAGEVTAILKVDAIGNNTKQNIEVSITDKAGNDREDVVKDFILSASLLTRFLANRPLVIITFAGLALVIAIVLIIIVKRRKKDEEA